MTTEWRIQWGRSIEGPDGGIDRCAPVDHHGGVATGVEGVNTSVLPPPSPSARTLSRAREESERKERAVLSYRTHYGLRIRTEACVQVWTYGAYARPSSEA